MAPADARKFAPELCAPRRDPAEVPIERRTRCKRITDARKTFKSGDAAQLRGRERRNPRCSPRRDPCAPSKPAIPRIAAEQLVSALSADGDRYLSAGKIRERTKGNEGRIGYRLVQPPQHGRNFVPYVGRAEHVLVMVCPDCGRDLSRGLPLADRTDVVIDGERFELSTDVLCRYCRRSGSNPDPRSERRRAERLRPTGSQPHASRSSAAESTHMPSFRELLHFVPRRSPVTSVRPSYLTSVSNQRGFRVRVAVPQ